jgi:hypothetical protein
MPYAVRAALIHHLSDLTSDSIQRLFPGDALELTFAAFAYPL